VTNSDEIQYWGACTITEHNNLKSAHNRDVQPYFTSRSNWTTSHTQTGCFTQKA